MVLSSSRTLGGGRPRSKEAGLVFLGGFGSGGTDLLKNVLNAHPEVSLPGEFPFLPRLADETGPLVPAHRAERVLARLRALDVYGNFPRPEAPLPPPQNGGYRLSALYGSLATRDHVRWTGNKSPGNTQNIDKLKAMFPDAKFVIIVRDVRDVALSWSRKWGKDKLACAAKWDMRMRLGRQLAAELPAEDVLFVRYEGLLEDLEGTARDLCQFLGLDFAPEMLTYHESVTAVVPGKLNYGKALIADNHGKWRTGLSSRDVRRIEEIAYQGMAVYGYSPLAAQGARPITRLESLRGRVRDAWATVFVGNRAIQTGRLRHRARTVTFELRRLAVARAVR